MNSRITIALMTASLLAAVALGQGAGGGGGAAPAGPGARGGRGGPGATPEQLAHYRKYGERMLIRDGNATPGVGAHDPSTILKCGDWYWTFTTGNRTPSYRSKDLLNWESGPPAHDQQRAWVPEAVPQNNGNSFWAPDIIKAGDKYLLFYSASSFGINTSAIGVLSNPTLNPEEPNFKWTDQGMVIRSRQNDDYNAIDPAPLLDDDGRLWVSFGSFWSGIQLIECDPKTGLRLPNTPLHRIAHWDSIEAPFLYKRNGQYYLFASLGMCCRGAQSTYHTVVGRSSKITGPYVDKEGKDMLLGGGLRVMETDGVYIGPGHAGIVEHEGKQWLSHHYYPATGGARLAIRPLTWSADGWPIVGTIE